MRVKLDLDGTDSVLQGLESIGKGLNNKVIGRLLMDSAKITERIMKNNAPVGMKSFERVSLLKRSDDYRRGGSTKRDIRRKLVFDTSQTATVLVGVNKSSGHVGWRAHFIELGTKKWAGKPFIERSGDATFPQVIQDFSGKVEAEIENQKSKAGLK